jgi:hypothetical protein
MGVDESSSLPGVARGTLRVASSIVGVLRAFGRTGVIDWAMGI